MTDILIALIAVVAVLVGTAYLWLCDRVRS
jgi:hypothetical protein